MLDPGLGFAKTAEHNWALLRALPAMTGLAGPGWGFPVLVGASRKRFLGALLADARRAPAARRPGGGHHRDLRAGRRGRRCGECGCTRPRPPLDAVRVAAATTGVGPIRPVAVPGLRGAPVVTGG